MKRLLLICGTALLLSPAALAAKPAPAPAAFTATLVSSQTTLYLGNDEDGNPSPQWTELTGCGYTVSSQVQIIFTQPSGAWGWWYTQADSSGCIFTVAVAGTLGTWSFGAYKPGNNPKLLAPKVSVTVLPLV